MKPARSPFEIPENLWKALTYSRADKISTAQMEQDAKDGTIRLLNEDAIQE